MLKNQKTDDLKKANKMLEYNDPNKNQIFSK